MIDLDSIINLLKENPEQGVSELEKGDVDLRKLTISKDESLELLTSGEKGIKEWNSIRAKLEIIEGIFYKVKFKRGVSFYVPNLKYVNFENINLPKFDLQDVDLDRVNFIGANLRDANFSYLSLRESRFDNADLQRARFFNSDLSNASLEGSYLNGAHFSGTELSRTNFRGAICSDTIFANVNLSENTGPLNLHFVRHYGPSEISISTFIKSKGEIPILFLEGCGVYPELISQLNAFSANTSNEYYSCFISYNHKDINFASSLYNKLQDKNIRVWFAPNEIKGGEKIYKQIDTAIKKFDKLLIVLSESSLASEWVITEIRKARQLERRYNRRVLFPISIVEYSKLQEWECFDSDVGKDLAVEIREYFIPDFSNWENTNEFDSKVDKLVRDLRKDS